MAERKRRSSLLRLMDVENTPEWIRDNEFIRTGYRVGYSFNKCLRSLFYLHNETMNIYTHLLGAILFIVLMFWTMNRLSPYGIDRLTDLHLKEKGAKYAQAIKEIWEAAKDRNLHTVCPSCSLTSRQVLHHIFENHWSQMKHIADVAKIEMLDNLRSIVKPGSKLYDKLDLSHFPLIYLPVWPILLFIASATLCLLLSTTFHLFFCNSELSLRRFQMMDYAGICCLISGTSTAAVYYGYFCNEDLQRYYVAVCLIVPAIPIVLLSSEYMSRPGTRHLRAALFVATGATVAVPLFQMFSNVDEHPTFLGLFFLGGLSYLIGAVLYGFRCPERFYPGLFDIWVCFPLSHRLMYI